MKRATANLSWIAALVAALTLSAPRPALASTVSVPSVGGFPQPVYDSGPASAVAITSGWTTVLSTTIAQTSYALSGHMGISAQWSITLHNYTSTGNPIVCTAALFVDGQQYGPQYSWGEPSAYSTLSAYGNIAGNYSTVTTTWTSAHVVTVQVYPSVGVGCQAEANSGSILLGLQIVP
ncbi:MAG: hypothetical protein ABSB49_09760 [Polyangia bacterium]|jgi:hypothetical protein